MHIRGTVDNEDWAKQTGSLWLRKKVPVGTEWVESEPTWLGEGRLHDPKLDGPSRMANRMHRNVGGLWAESLAPFEGQEVNGNQDELQYEYL